MKLALDSAAQLLAELGLMLDAGAAAISDGGRPVRDTIGLRHALLYARPLGAPVLLRAGDPALEAGGVMHEGEISARIGLRGIHHRQGNDQLVVLRKADMGANHPS